MRKIAIVYDNGKFICNQKKHIQDVLKNEITNKGNNHVFETDKIIIHWVNKNKVNLTKFYEKYEIDETIVVDSKNIDLQSILDEEIEKAYGKIEIFIPVFSYNGSIKEYKDIETKIASGLYLKKTNYMLNKKYFLSLKDAKKYVYETIENINSNNKVQLERIEENIKRNEIILNQIKEELDYEL